MPNRRRRRLSTAMNAVAALAVASPFAYVAVSELTADLNKGTDSAPQHREFVRAAVMTDLPDELMSALSQGLSQFGVTLPSVPGLSGTSAVPAASPGLISPGLTSPGLTAPGALPSVTSPGLTDPGLTSPGLTSPGLTSPGLTSPGVTAPTLPGAPVGVDPYAPGLTAPNGEVPIAAPVGLDPGADGTYPILGDPSLGAAPAASSGSGGLVSDLMSAAQQLGVNQVIDLLKGSITQAAQGAQGAAPAIAAPAIAAPAPPVLPGT